MTFSYLKILGDNAATFLQGQLTCDINEVAEEHSVLGSHCNQKGRVLFNFLLLKKDGHFYLKLPSNMLSFAKNRLEKFAIFSRVTLEEADLACSGYLLAENKLAEIQQGFVTIQPKTKELFTPHELNYPRFKAINFKKGCYTGQEIIARMEYLGKLKKHLYLAEIESLEAPILASTVIGEDQIQETGLIADYCQHENKFLILILLNDSASTEKNYLTINAQHILFQNIRLA